MRIATGCVRMSAVCQPRDGLTAEIVRTRARSRLRVDDGKATIITEERIGSAAAYSTRRAATGAGRTCGRSLVPSFKNLGIEAYVSAGCC